jgi:hypothetical protein
MASRNVSKLVAESAFTYSVSLRVRHPTLDPAVLTEALRLEPAHSWKAGEPRRSQTGNGLGGQHRDSYWSAPLAGQAAGTVAVPLEMFISQQLVQLARHRAFLHELQAGGAEVSLLIEMSAVANAVLTVSTAVARKLADLNVEMEFQFVGD